MARSTLLSPSRYIRQGFGLALPDGFTLSQLRSTIVRAQAQVDRYCNVPKQPSQFNWRGGTMVGETHQWKIINPLAYGPGARRVYLNVGPIKEVTAFNLDLGKTYMVSIDPTDDIYINSIEQYIELVAINPTIAGFYPLAVNLGLYNPLARVSYTYGWTFDVTGDVLEAETPSLFSAAYGNWDSTIVPTVYFDGTEVNVADYTVNYDDGMIAFSSGNEPGVNVEVTADYTYTVPDAVVQAVGITATSLIGASRLAARGMAGLQSIKVAEVALTAFQPSQMVTKNGATIPAEAASLLSGYTFGSAF